MSGTPSYALTMLSALKKIAIGILLAIAVLIGPTLLRLGWYVLRGHYIGSEGVSEYIVRNNLDPLECNKIELDPFQFGYPSRGSRRSGCVHGVASLRQDPSICELLLPSEFGLSCISSIWGPLEDESNCHWYQDNSIRCFEGEKLIPRVTLCEESTAKNLPDECWHRMAFKKKDPALCKEIVNSVLRSVCEVRINTWNKYPEVRSTIYFSMP